MFVCFFPFLWKRKRPVCEETDNQCSPPSDDIFFSPVKVILESFLRKTNFEIQIHLSGSATNTKTAIGGRDEEARHLLRSDGARIIERAHLMTETQVLNWPLPWLFVLPAFKSQGLSEEFDGFLSISGESWKIWTFFRNEPRYFLSAGLSSMFPWQHDCLAGFFFSDSWRSRQV